MGIGPLGRDPATASTLELTAAALSRDCFGFRLIMGALGSLGLRGFRTAFGGALGSTGAGLRPWFNVSKGTLIHNIPKDYSIPTSSIRLEIEVWWWWWWYKKRYHHHDLEGRLAKRRMSVHTWLFPQRAIFFVL